MFIEILLCMYVTYTSYMYDNMYYLTILVDFHFGSCGRYRSGNNDIHLSIKISLQESCYSRSCGKVMAVRVIFTILRNVYC